MIPPGRRHYRPWPSVATRWALRSYRLNPGSTISTATLPPMARSGWQRPFGCNSAPPMPCGFSKNERSWPVSGGIFRGSGAHGHLSRSLKVATPSAFGRGRLRQRTRAPQWLRCGYFPPGLRPFASRNKIALLRHPPLTLRPRVSARCRPMPAAAGRRHEGRERRGSGHGDHHGKRPRSSP